MMKYNSSNVILERFTYILKKYNSNAAVRHNTRILTYEELDRKSEIYVNYLIERNISSILILGESSIELIAFILACVKARVTYIPVDAQTPEDRLRYIISNSKPDLMLLEPTYSRCVNEETRSLFDSPETFEEFILFYRIKGFSEHSIATSNPLYVMYTSGSTGQPKGVIVLAEAVLSMAVNNSYLQIYSDDCVAQTSNLAFDGSTFEIWGALLNGATLAVLNDVDRFNPSKLAELIARNNISIIVLTSAIVSIVANSKPNALNKLRALLFGGEKSNDKNLHIINKSENRPEKIIHLYGPTENTTFSTFYEMLKGLDDDKSIPIGQSISRVRCHILDSNMDPISLGEEGELYLSGAGLALGYLGNPRNTAESFLPNPFDHVCGERMYRTGDLVKIDSQGQIVFIGRKDNQVKIRGYRIELSEIDHHLMNIDGIVQAHTKIFENNGDKYLCSYVSGEGKGISNVAIKESLERSLPDYMIPRFIIHLDSMPLNINKKIDTHSLPSPMLQVSHLYEAAQNCLLTTIADIWRDLLPGVSIENDSDFFEIGGHSLLAIRFITVLSERLNVDIPMKGIFDFPVLQEFSTYLSLEFGTELNKSESNRSFAIPLQQRSLIIGSILNSNKTLYNVSFLIRFDSPLSYVRVADALLHVLKKFGAFSARFEMSSSGDISMSVTDNFYENINTFEPKENSQSAVDQYISQIWNDSQKFEFGIFGEPLYRISSIKHGSKVYALILNFHHVLMDEWSLNIFFQEFRIAYDRSLGHRHVDWKESFKKYTSIVDAYNTTAEKNKGRTNTFWRREIESANDNDTVSVDLDKTKKSEFEIGKADIDLIKNYCKRNKVTLFTFFMTAYAMAVSALNSKGNVILGTTIANRRFVDAESALGYFTGLYPFSISLNKFANTLSVAEYVNSKYFEILNNLDISTEEITCGAIEYFFGYSQSLLNLIQLGDSEAIIQLPNSQKPKFPFSFFVNQGSETAKCSILTADSSFNEEYIQSFSDAFIHAIASLLNVSMLKEYYEELRYSSFTFQDKLSSKFNIDNRYISLFDALDTQVNSNPEQIALQCGERIYSYRLLKDSICRIASFFKSIGVNKGDTILLNIGSSDLDIICKLALNYIGAAFFPVSDSDLLGDTLGTILDFGSKGIVVNDISFQLINNQMPVLCSENDIQDLLLRKSTFQSQDPDFDKISYSILTSGSTGGKKIVSINSYSLISTLNALWSDKNLFNIFYKRKVLSAKAASFDSPIKEILMMLLGATYIVPEEKVRCDLSALKRHLDDVKPDIIEIPPFYYSKLISDGFNVDDCGVSAVILGGEKIDEHLFSYILRSKVTHVNVYGTTETTIFDSWCVISEDVQILGNLLPGSRFYILDDNFNYVMPGVMGSIFIAGPKVSNGYINSETETASKFLPDIQGVGTRMYRTGDCAYYNRSGSVVFKGRLDREIKRNGVRINLDYVESLLSVSEHVLKCVVLSCEKIIVAYVLPCNVNLYSNIIENDFSKLVPRNLLPDRVFFVSEISTNVNGKINYRLLDKYIIDLPKYSSDYSSNYSHEEEVVLSYAKNLCGYENLSAVDNLFLHGIDSFGLIELIQRVNIHFNCNISYHDAYATPSVRSVISLCRFGLPKFASRSLVSISKGYSNKYVLFVHPIGGDIACYRNLFDCFESIDVELIAFQRQEFNGFSTPSYKSVEELAYEYVEEFTAKYQDQLDGDIYIVGWSFGGIVGYQMAAELQLRGIIAKKVILIDTHLYKTNTSTNNSIWGFENIWASIEDRLNQSQDRSKNTQNFFETKTFIRDICEAHWRAMVSFTPKGKIKNMSLIMATESVKIGPLVNRYPFFESMALDEMAVHEVQGDHHSIVVGNDSAKTGDILLNEMNFN